MFKKTHSELISKLNKYANLCIFSILVFITDFFIVNAEGVPPGLIPDNTGLPGDSISANTLVKTTGGTLISELIQYVAVIAVISLMISGVMYLISGGEEEKVKKAKTWIISSLVGVVLSISAFAIIKIINNITI